MVVLAIIAVAAVGAGGTGAYLVRRAFPQISGTLVAPGLSEPVEVIRDRWGIPHIYARSRADLAFAQGFVHAQDRLWQMELNRRTASGRLAEIFGEAVLGTDRFLRTVGLRRAAEVHLRPLAPETRIHLDAYAAGVNAFLRQARGRLPIEFAILGLTPEPWTPADTLAYGKLLAWILGGDWRVEILRQQLVARFGDDALGRLLPGYPADAPVIVPAVGATGRTGGAPPERAPGVPGLVLAGRPGLGSNNWVVAGDRTATGRPLLANDPHLEAQMPSVWYLMHLSDDRHEVAGATFPGVPGVIIGHNRDIAWGVTNANPDVQDLFVERFHPNDPSRYLYRGTWVPATIIEEPIRVKGRAAPLIETVRVTRHGPILNNVVRGLGEYVALRWTALESSAIIEAVDALNRAASWEEFRGALRAWDAPAQNFVFAHRDGDIGYQFPGRVPVRRRNSSGVPVPGWTGDHEWTGTLPFEALPTAHRRSGVIVTANNRVESRDYPHFLGRDWDPGFRARRITALLAGGPHTVETFKTMQMDVTSLPGKAIVEALRSVPITDPALRDLFAELVAWNGVLDASSRAAALYEALLDALVREVFRGSLDEAVFARYLRHYDGPILTLLELLREPSSPWWRGHRDQVVEAAFHAAVRELERRLGPDRARWRWGRLHRPTFLHPLGRVRALAWIFNTTPPETGGDAFTVNMGAFDPEEPFRHRIVASYRQILDLADWDRSLVIHTTGQSGLPFHRHYRDFAARWARGEYVPLLFSRASVEQAAEGRLTLRPAAP
jgi:penicillin amidase